MGENEHIATYEGYYEDIAVMRDLAKMVLASGGKQEMIKILKERGYEILFLQDQYLRGVYRTISQLRDESEEKEQSESHTLLTEFMGDLERDIQKNNEKLKNWDSEIDRKFEELDE